MIRRSWNDTFRVAMAGILYTCRTQRNMPIHLLMAVLMCTLGFICKITSEEWLWLLLAITLVISSELINTAIEAVVDLTMSKQHPLARIAKDTAAGAVLITAIFAVIVGIYIFYMPLIYFLII